MASMCVVNHLKVSWELAAEEGSGGDNNEENTFLALVDFTVQWATQKK